MYIRQAKQFLRNVDASFDERRYGFGSLVDLMRACQREGLFRIERDRQGVMRLFPGNVMQQPVEAVHDGLPVDEELAEDISSEAQVESRGESVTSEEWRAEPAAEPELVDGDVVQEIDTPSVIDVQPEQFASPEEASPQHVAAERTRKPRRRRPEGEARSSRKAADGNTAAPRARKSAAKPRAARSRRPKETQPSDADSRGNK
jgi:hypothetical protein